MQFKITHRRYPDSKWDYKAVSTNINGMDIYYYTLVSKGKRSSGVEVFSGKNYVVDSQGRSYSRAFKLGNLPIKYNQIVSALKKKHSQVKWSKAERVDMN